MPNKNINQREISFRSGDGVNLNGTLLSGEHPKKGAVFQGEDDPQAPIDEIEEFKKHRKDLIIFRYPNLGHGFSPKREGRHTLGPISDQVLGDIIRTLNKL